MMPFSSSVASDRPSATSRSNSSACWLSPAPTAARTCASLSRLVSTPSASFKPASKQQQSGNSQLHLQYDGAVHMSGLSTSRPDAEADGLCAEYISCSSCWGPLELKARWHISWLRGDFLLRRLLLSTQ